MIKVQERFLLALGLLLIVLPTVIAQAPFKWDTATSKQINVCREKQCHERAKLLLESIDKTVNPCDDFYEYACGQWIQQNRIPPHQYEWSIEAKLDFQSIQELSDLLKKSVTPRDTEDIVKAKQLYLICKNIPSIPKMMPNLLKSYVKRAGAWPMFNPDQKFKVSWLEIHNHYLKISGDGGLFGIGLRYDGVLDEIFIKIGNPATPSGLIQHYGEWNSEELYKHQQFLLTLAELVLDKSLRSSPENAKSKSSKPVITHKDLLKDILDVIMFRKRLEKNIHPDNYDLTPVPLKYFQLWYDIKVTSQKGGTKIPWIKILDNLFKETSLNPVTGDSKIVLMHRDSFSFLPRLLATTPKHVIANHLHLYFIEKHVLMNPELNNALSRVLIHNGKIMGTMHSRLDRSDYCVTTHPMRETLGKMYLNKYFSEGTRESALYYAQRIKNMIRIFISSSKWMDHELKEILLSKLTHVGLNMAYQSNRKGEYVYSRDTKMTPYRAVSFYMPKEHSIFISAGYFRSPVFDHELPSSVNYGTISTFIAYELYHALTTPQLQGDAPMSKALCTSCLSDDMQKVFSNKTKCFENMYNDVVDKELDKIRPLPKTNGVRTLYENIADVMAVRTGMEAYKKLLWESKGKCRILPHMKDYTCEKLFFISYAATFCSNIPTWTLLKHVQMGTHSTPRLRVNVPLANMEEFRTAFHCPKDSPMVAENKCNLW